MLISSLKKTGYRKLIDGFLRITATSSQFSTPTSSYSQEKGGTNITIPPPKIKVSASPCDGITLQVNVVYNYIDE